MASKLHGKRVLIVGLACLDIMNTVDHYPNEDEDMRALSQRWQKGGNAANTAEVLSQTLGTSCELLCSLNQGLEGEFIKGQLQKRGVLVGNCPLKENCGFPTSCVFINCASGTRTIVHGRNDLPELSFEDFNKMDMSVYCWIHFEGRHNLDEIIKMIRKIEAFKNSTKAHIKVSVELEKKRDELKKVLGLADVVFIGKDFAQFCGFNHPEEAINGFSSQVKPTASLICAWGDMGAFAMESGGRIVSSCAFPPDRIIDTLGAGDTFNAGVIFYLKQGKALEDALEFGCKLAGRKCGIQGFDGL